MAPIDPLGQFCMGLLGLACVGLCWMSWRGAQEASGCLNRLIQTLLCCMAAGVAYLIWTVLTWQGR